MGFHFESCGGSTCPTSILCQICERSRCLVSGCPYSWRSIIIPVRRFWSFHSYADASPFPVHFFMSANSGVLRHGFGSYYDVDWKLRWIGHCAQKPPRTVQASFFSLTHWLKVSNKQQPQCARGEYRQAARTLQTETRSLRTRRYLKLCLPKTSETEIFLAKCLKKNQQCLPD